MDLEIVHAKSNKPLVTVPDQVRPCHMSQVARQRSPTTKKQLTNTTSNPFLTQAADPTTDPGVNAYQFMLEQNVGKTMLQFQVIMHTDYNSQNIHHNLSRS